MFLRMSKLFGIREVPVKIQHFCFNSFVVLSSPYKHLFFLSLERVGYEAQHANFELTGMLAGQPNRCNCVAQPCIKQFITTHSFIGSYNLMTSSSVEIPNKNLPRNILKKFFCLILLLQMWVQDGSWCFPAHSVRDAVTRQAALISHPLT